MTIFENCYTSFVANELHTNGFNDSSLFIISIISIIFGVLVIISKNPIISVLFLIGLFMSISFYLMLLGFNFLGISYLLVYIGAVSILFLFILMLINVRVSELVNNTYNSIILSVLITIYFTATLNQEVPYKEQNKIDIFKLADINRDVSYVSYESWDTNLTSLPYITSIGNVLYTNYSIWLILTSIILLLAMVGCIIVTIKQK